MSDPSTPEPPASPASPLALRASDAERERVVNVLRQAAGEGRLNVDELNERLTLAYSIKTSAELEALTADVVVRLTRTALSTHGAIVRPGEGGTRNVISITGGHDAQLSDRPAPPGAPVIRIRLVSIMGAATVRQGRKRTRADKRPEKELRRAEQRGELGE